MIVNGKILVLLIGLSNDNVMHYVMMENNVTYIRSIVYGMDQLQKKNVKI